MDFADAAQFADTRAQRVVTSSGQDLSKKCMVLFGRRVCLCEFLDFIGVHHLCYPKTKMSTAAKKGQIKKVQQKIDAVGKSLKAVRTKKSVLARNAKRDR